MAEQNLITQAELAALAPDLDLSRYSAPTVSGMIAMATAWVVRYCNVDGFFKVAVTGERGPCLIDNQGNLTISFRRRPVAYLDVSAIRLLTVDVNQSLLLTNNASGHAYFLNDEGTTLTYPSNFLVSHGVGLLSMRASNLSYEIDYTGGYAVGVADMPQDLKMACVMAVMGNLSLTQNVKGLQGFQQGSYREDYGSNASSSGLTMHHKNAQSILDSGGYVRKTIF